MTLLITSVHVRTVSTCTHHMPIFLSHFLLLTKTIPNVFEFHDPNLSDFSNSFAKSSRGCSFLKNVSLGSKDSHQP